MTDQLSPATEELRRELDRVDGALASGRIGPPPTDPLQAHLARMRATRMITSNHPTLVRGGVLAAPKRWIKKAAEAATRSMVEQVAVDARRFADAATDTSAVLAEEQALSRSEIRTIGTQVDRDMAALRDRIVRLERAGRHTTAGPSSQPEAPVPALGPTEIDYFAFEGVMRGPRHEIRTKQEQYVSEFAAVDYILDVGCGRGEFLEILRQVGKRAAGIDLDGDMVAHCVAEGLDVQQADAVQHLRALPEATLGGVFAAQVVEHMKPPVLSAFLEAARRALQPGGIIALETINPGSISALKNYFADLTHAQPLVPETLMFLVEQAGFTNVRMDLRSPVADEARLAHVPFAGSVPESAQAASDRNVDIINALLFAPQDYAVIASA